MATNYPAGLDNLTNPVTTDPVNSPSHAVQHANANDAIEALQAKVGTNNSLVTTSIDYRVRQLEANPVGTANKITQLVINNTGSTLAKGKVVYASGSVGASGQLRVSLSSNAAESTSSKTFGVLAEQIIQGGQGTVVCEGLLENIDTTGANDGDPIWLGTNGSMIFGLANKPVAPAHLVFVGIVVRGGNANNGSIFVKVQNGFELDELHTVLLSSLADKDLLTYDSATGLWKNKTFTTLDIPTKTYVDTALSNLSNTVTTDYVPVADVGQPDGVASLDSTGKIPLAQMGNLVAGAPTALDTLNELATALGNNPNYATDITTALGTKVSKNGGDTITTSSTSTIPLKIKDITSQSVSSQEWLRSDNTPYAWMANGTNTGTVNFQTGVIRASSNLVAGYQITGGQSAGFNVASNSAMGQANWNTGLYTLYLRNASGQTADSLRIESSSGAPLAKITADGSFRAGGANGATKFLVDQFGTLSLGTDRNITGTPTYLFVQSQASSDIGAVVKGASGQSANLQEWQNSAGTVLAKINASGSLNFSQPSAISEPIIDISIPAFHVHPGVLTRSGTAWITALNPTGLDSYWQGRFYSRDTATVALWVKGKASQTADLQQWQNSAGTVLAKIDKDGNFISSYATSSILAGGGRAIIDAYGAIYTLDTLTVGSTSDRFAPGAVSIIHRSGNTTHVTVGIKGMASQTGDLTQWQNSSGTVLAKITSTGAFDATAITVNGSPISGGAQYQTTAPSSPTVGQIWIDSDDDIEAFDLTNKKTEIPASISANTNLVAGRRYFVTSASALTLTLPASPALNDEIQVIDASGNASTYNITIARNGNFINGTAGNLIIDNNGGWYSLLYTGTTYGWKVG